MASNVLNFEAQAVHWLRDKPRTIIIDRLDFILNRENFQMKIDRAALEGKKLELPTKQLFLVKHSNVWYRATIKFFDETSNKCVLLCVDTSITMRAIDDPEVMNEAWCRMKCYIFGIEMQDFSPIPHEMVELFDRFFMNCQFTTLAVPIPQHNKEALRHTYCADFIKQTADGYQSFRNLLFSAKFGKPAYIDQRTNQALEHAVDQLLIEINREESTIRS